MRWIAVAAGVLLVAGVLAGSEEQAAEEESPLIYTLEVNGTPCPIEPGKLLTLPAQKGPVKVLLKVAPYRVFRVPGAEFQFPRGWHVERRSKVTVGWETPKGHPPSWILGMRRFNLHVSMRRGERAAAHVIGRMIELQRSVTTKAKRVTKVIRNDRPLRLAGHNVAGTTYYEDLEPSIIGTVSTYYALRTGPDTVLFIFSELREGDLPGEPSTEWKEMERWLQESLKVAAPRSADN